MKRFPFIIQDFQILKYENTTIFRLRVAEVVKLLR